MLLIFTLFFVNFLPLHILHEGQAQKVALLAPLPFVSSWPSWTRRGFLSARWNRWRKRKCNCLCICHFLLLSLSFCLFVFFKKVKAHLSNAMPARTAAKSWGWRLCKQTLTKGSVTNKTNITNISKILRNQKYFEERPSHRDLWQIKQILQIFRKY